MADLVYSSATGRHSLGLFDSSFSPLSQHNGANLGGFTNAVTKERIRYDQFKEYAAFISTALVQKFNLSAGDTVALFSHNTVWYPVAMFATTRVGMFSPVLLPRPACLANSMSNETGGIISGASPAYNVEEMTYALRTANAKILMTAASSLPVAIPAAENAGIPKDRIILLEGEQDGFTTIKNLVAFGKAKSTAEQASVYTFSRGQTNKDLCGFLSFSSGTTGLPKAVSISRNEGLLEI